jgi:hypothetical protein
MGSVGDEDNDELGFYQERPFSVRLTKFLVITVALLFIWPPMRIVWLLVILFAEVVVFSSPLRHAGIGFGWDSLVVVAMLLGMLAVGLIPVSIYQRVFYGRRWFGKLSEVRSSLVVTVLRASSELSFTLDEKNKQIIKSLADLNRDEMKWSMGRQYRILHSRRTEDDTADIEMHWNAIWQERVLKSSSGGRTVAQAFEPDSYAWVTIPLRLTGIVAALQIMTVACEIVVFWILISRLESKSSLLLVFQVAVAFSVAITLIIFLYHSYNLPDIPIISSREIGQQGRLFLRSKERKMLEENIRTQEEEFGERFASFKDQSISVIRVKVSPRYFSLIRNYYARSLALDLVSNSLAGFVLIAIAAAFLWILGVKGEPNIGSLYTQLAIALALIPVGIIGIYLLVFTLVAQFRSFTTLALTGALIVVIPPAANYLFAGRLPASPVSFVSSAIVGIIGSAGADLALRSRKRISG